MQMQEPGFLSPFLSAAVPWLYIESSWWTAFGLIGNGMFAARFYVQWLASEKSKRLVVPPLFWQLSFWGSIISLLYALHVDKLPIILGFAALPFIHGRNLVLLGRGERPAGGVD